MNLAHFHVISVHLPIIAVLLLVILLASGIKFKKPDLSKAALIGLVIVALLTIPIYLTGESAEEWVEHMPSISEHQIEEHESAATVAFVLVLVSGFVSLITLFLTQLKNSKAALFMTLTLLLGIACTGTLVWTGSEGGEIRHTEFSKPRITKSKHKKAKKKKKELQAEIADGKGQS